MPTNSERQTYSLKFTLGFAFSAMVLMFAISRLFSDENAPAANSTGKGEATFVIGSVRDAMIYPSIAAAISITAVGFIYLWPSRFPTLGSVVRGGSILLVALSGYAAWGAWANIRVIAVREGRVTFVSLLGSWVIPESDVVSVDVEQFGRNSRWDRIVVHCDGGRKFATLYSLSGLDDLANEVRAELLEQ